MLEKRSLKLSQKAHRQLRRLRLHMTGQNPLLMYGAHLLYSSKNWKFSSLGPPPLCFCPNFLIKFFFHFFNKNPYFLSIFSLKTRIFSKNFHLFCLKYKILAQKFFERHVHPLHLPAEIFSKIEKHVHPLHSPTEITSLLSDLTVHFISTW
jgi:hypothetical protein